MYNKKDLIEAFEAGREYQEYKSNINLEEKSWNYTFDKWFEQYNLNKKTMKTKLIQLYDKEGMELGLYNVPETIPNVDEVFEACAKDLNVDEREEFDALLEDNFGIVRVFTEEVTINKYF